MKVLKEISLRSATPADAAAIAAVRIESWRVTYRGMIPDACLDGMKLDDSTAHWEKILNAGNDNIAVYIAECDAQIIGFASALILPETKLGCEAELTAIYLQPALQRSGIGRRMVQKLAKFCLAKNAHGLLVWVIAGNHAARRFYETLGASLLLEQDFNWDGLDLVEAGYAWRDLPALIDLPLLAVH